MPINMKVCIATTKGSWSCSQTGKGFHALRLIPALKRLGVDVTENWEDKVDITLGIGKFLYETANKKVLRLGAVHFSAGYNWKKPNKRKKKAVKKADGVIYQSQFSKSICRKYLGKGKGPETVIFNGASIVKPENDKRVYMMSTRTWIRQKRLKNAVQAFLMADIDAELHIYGETEGRARDYRREPKVFFHGPVKQQEVQEALKKANVLLHPTYLDACPNSVAEALCAGCRVICTDQGGTKELVKDNGTVVIDKPWNGKPINLEHPPSLDKNAMAEAIRFEFANEKTVDAGYLDIDKLAKDYVKFFEKVLNG